MTLDIVTLIEKNPLTRLSKEYNSKLIDKIKNKFTDKQQQLFVSSFYCYLNYDTKSDFIIDLDNIWKWLGFSRKDPAKRALENNFVKNIDYNIVFHNDVENTKSGRPSEQILLNIETFKGFCMVAGTEKSKEIRQYYLQLESLLHEIINEESGELRQQLENSNKNLQMEIAKLKKRNKINYESKDRVYVYEDITNDNKPVYKVGYSTNFNVRVQTYDGARFENKLQYETDCINGKLLEAVVHHVLIKYQDPEKKEWFHANIDIVKQAIYTSKLYLDNHNEQFDAIKSILIKQETAQEPPEEIIQEPHEEIAQEKIQETPQENTIIKDFSLYKRFFDECTTQGEDFTAIASDVSGMFRLWNKRSSTDERSMLTEYLSQNYKPVRMGIWNEEKKMFQNAYKGFKLNDYTYTPSIPPTEYDNFIQDVCRTSFSSRVTTYDITNTFLEWKRKNNMLVTDDKKETCAFSNYLAKKFIRITGKFIYKGKPESGGFWGITLKSNDVQDACHKTESQKKRKMVYKIDPTSNTVVHTYGSLSECSQTLNNDMSYKIKNKSLHNGFIYSYQLPT